MIRITDIRLPLDYDDKTILNAAAKALQIEPGAIESAALFRRSVDARHKNDVHFRAALDVTLLQNEQKILNRSKNRNAALAAPYEYAPPAVKKLPLRPVIAGAGPAGLFCALILAQCGAEPLVL